MCMPLMPALEKQRLAGVCEFTVSLVFIVLGQSRLCSETCLQQNEVGGGRKRETGRDRKRQRKRTK